MPKNEIEHTDDDMLENIKLLDATIRDLTTKENSALKKAYKTKDIKMDSKDFNWEKKYKAMDHFSNYDDNGKYSPNYTEQINSLWQENKNLQNQMAYLITVIEGQTKIIKELQEKFQFISSEKFDEINDRLDDMESRIDLIDE